MKQQWARNRKLNQYLHNGSLKEYYRNLKKTEKETETFLKF